MKKIKLSIFLLAAVGLMTSCNDFLNKYPDNRMELRTPSDVSKLVASAYPDAYPAYLLEMYSDNTDEQVNETWSSLNRFQEQAYGWADITETGVPDVPQKLWNASYSAISTANAAIEFIEKQSNQDAYQGQLGEAKICRAYAMFQLANVFCRAYNPNTAEKELGLPYPYAVENDPRATYQRGTLAQLYSNIEKDLTEGMELISNNNYAQPKYHFTPAAAHAFAARFYLYARQYEKAIAHADAVLGTDATPMLRDWEQWRKLGANDQVQPNDYIKSSKNTNLLLFTGMSMWGYVSRPVGIGSKYAHGKLLSSSETLESKGPWGESGTVLNYMVTSGSNVSKVALGKIPLKLDQYDPQAKTGVPYAQFSVFNADETLLVRAEAKALLGRYEEAVADINTLLKVFIRSEAKSTEATRTLTLKGIQSFYNALRYYTPSQPTVKKQLHTDFTIEATTQEPLLQCILHLRRLVTIHEGLRMQDVKRYGMTIYRRRVSVENRIIEVTDSMKTDDPRQAIQLPQDVITAGLQANPR